MIYGYQPRDHDDVIPWEKGGVKSNSRMGRMSRIPAITSYRGKRVVPNLIESSWNVLKEPSFVKVTWLCLLLLKSRDCVFVECLEGAFFC